MECVFKNKIRFVFKVVRKSVLGRYCTEGRYHRGDLEGRCGVILSKTLMSKAEPNIIARLQKRN